MKKQIVFVLILSLIVNTIFINKVYATEIGKTQEIEGVQEKEIFIEETFEESIEKLYGDIANKFNLPYQYVKILHLVAGGKAIYADKKPNIMLDLTSEGFRPPLEGRGITINYNKKYGINLADETIERPNRYYLPDAIYNATDDLLNHYKEREKHYESSEEKHLINEFNTDVKNNVIFYEALLKYCNANEEEVESLIDTYIKILEHKDKYEYVVQINSAGEYKIRDKYKEFLQVYSENSKEILAIAFSFDGNLAIHNSLYDITNTDDISIFKIGETSRENLILAAFSLLGQVKYVWGGGHMGASDIRGINPIWSAFNNKYENNSRGKNTCIAPKRSWCPVHGSYENTDNSCLFTDRKVYSLNDYLKYRNNLYKDNLLSYTKLVDVFQGDFKELIEPHRLEGLDCSGFIAWCYNQIDLNRTYKGVSGDFVKINGMRELRVNEKLLPGDIVAWDTHIVMVVGKTKENHNTYIIIEQAPNNVKLGVLAVTGATAEQINIAENIAREANGWFSENLKEETINKYNIQGLGRRVNEETGQVNNTLVIGRFNGGFIDENRNYYRTDKPIKDMTGLDIINNIIIRINGRGSVEQY